LIVERGTEEGQVHLLPLHRGQGKCDGVEYVREEKIAKEFRKVLEAIVLPADHLDYVRDILKDNHDEQREYHQQALQRLNQEYSKLENRINEMYDDRLDGLLSKEQFIEKSEALRERQQDVRRKIEKHEAADRNYMLEGVQLLELLQNVVAAYVSADMPTKRRILDFVTSNSVWKDGQIYPNYREPFAAIALMGTGAETKQAVSTDENGL